MKGRFIVLDGIDGVGKSTQLSILADRLRRKGKNPLTVRDPGDTPLGRHLRQLLLGRNVDALTSFWRRLKVNPDHTAATTEALLYAASRAQLVAEVIRPALKKGRVVLCDRYSTATLAYQGALGKSKGLAEVCRFAEDGVRPDLSILLDCPPKSALKRREGREPDRLEARGLGYQARVRAGFLAQARRDPRRIKVVSALGTAEEVADRILVAVERAL